MTLRTILIAIGVLIFIAILVDGYRHWRRAKQHENELDKRSEPQFDKKINFKNDLDFEPKLKFNEPDLSPEPEFKFDHTEAPPAPKAPVVTSKPTSAKSAPVKMPEPLPKKDKFIILHVLAEADTYFSGEALVSKFSEHKLHFGPMDIYHFYENDGYGDIIFSVANAFEPGTLILDYPQGFYTQGLTFFIQLPGQCEPEESFEAMLNTATLLAKSLNARLCDHQRQPLTPQRVEQYRHEVTACNVI
jgi:cell division protein ZipA